MGQAEVITCSERRKYFNRVVFALKILIAATLLFYLYRSPYSATYNVNAGRTKLCATWLLLFCGASLIARRFVKRPVSIAHLRWPISFLAAALASTVAYPVGSLYLTPYLWLRNLFFWRPMGPLRVSAASLAVVTVFAAYIHYTILAYEDTDARTLRQMVRQTVDSFMKKKTRLLWLLILIPVVYQSYLFFGQMDTPDIERLMSIKIPAGDISIPVGARSPIYVVGAFPFGKTYQITAPDFGTQYMSNDPSVATVSDKGIVFGVSPGETIIHVENRDCSAEVPVKILREDDFPPSRRKQGVGANAMR